MSEARSSLKQCLTPPLLSYASLARMSSATEDWEDILRRGLAPTGQSAQDPVRVQAGLDGDYLGALVTQSAMQSLPLLVTANVKWQTDRRPFVGTQGIRSLRPLEMRICPIGAASICHRHSAARFQHGEPGIETHPIELSVV